MNPHCSKHRKDPVQGNVYIFKKALDYAVVPLVAHELIKTRSSVPTINNRRADVPSSQQHTC